MDGITAPRMPVVTALTALIGFVVLVFVPLAAGFREYGMPVAFLIGSAFLISAAIHLRPPEAYLLLFMPVAGWLVAVLFTPGFTGGDQPTVGVWPLMLVVPAMLWGLQVVDPVRGWRLAARVALGVLIELGLFSMVGTVVL